MLCIYIGQSVGRVGEDDGSASIDSEGVTCHITCTVACAPVGLLVRIGGLWHHKRVSMVLSPNMLSDS